MLQKDEAPALEAHNIQPSEMGDIDINFIILVSSQQSTAIKNLAKSAAVNNKQNQHLNQKFTKLTFCMSQGRAAICLSNCGKYDKYDNCSVARSALSPAVKKVQNSFKVSKPISNSFQCWTQWFVKVTDDIQWHVFIDSQCTWKSRL